MSQKHKAGFTLIEVMLALVVITIAGLGAYSLFDSGVKSNKITDAENEAVQIANVYTDLASAGLTSSDEDIPSLLKNSGRLSSKYFSTNSSSTVMMNAFGPLTFTSPTAYSFSVSIPLGCLPADSILPKDFFNKVRDMYSCNGSDSYSDDCVVACSGATSTYLNLSFSMSN